MPTNTTNYSFNKPNVNSADDEDLWGGQLNDNWDSLDALLKPARDFLTNAQTGSYSVQASDKNKLITCDASGGAFAVTLLAAATAGDGFEVAIKKTDQTKNAVTITGTVDGLTNPTLTQPGQGVVLVSNGSAWFIKSSRDNSPLPRRTFVTASGSFTFPTGVSKVRAHVYGAGGGGGQDSAGSAGGNTTCTDGTTLLTANGGGGGTAAYAEAAAPAHGTATGGTFNKRGAGAVGGLGAGEKSGNDYSVGGQGGNGGYATIDYEGTGGTTQLTIVIGTGGAKGSGGAAAQNGEDGYVILEY